MHDSTQGNETSPGPLTDALIATLESERQTLVELDGEFRAQIDAIVARDIDAIEEATHRTNVAVAKLESVRKSRLRQTKLLARVLEIPGDEIRVAQITDRIGGQVQRSRQLEELRDEIVGLADNALTHSEDVAFLLQHSLELNQDLMRSAHAMGTPPPSRLYTAQGTSASPASSALVNRLG